MHVIHIEAMNPRDLPFTASCPPAAVCGKDGKPLLSWRVAILPFIGQETLYNEFRLDEAWDSEDTWRAAITRNGGDHLGPDW